MRIDVQDVQIIMRDVDGMWIWAFDLDGIPAAAPASEMACRMAFDPYALSATIAVGCFCRLTNAPRPCCHGFAPVIYGFARP